MEPILQHTTKKADVVVHLRGCHHVGLGIVRRSYCIINPHCTFLEGEGNDVVITARPGL
jgi:hypothetical protein